MSSKFKRPPLSDEEVSAYAKRLYRGELFTSWMIERRTPIELVFPVLIFLDREQRQALRHAGAAHLWAETADRANLMRSANGYPMCFGITGWWTEEEGDRIRARLAEITEAIDRL